MTTKSSLTTPQRRLLETLQKINFGRIERLEIRNGEPMFDPAPRVVKDVKLGNSDNEARPELKSGDFALKREHVDLFQNLIRIGSGTIEAIEIRHGLPFRILFEQQP